MKGWTRRQFDQLCNHLQDTLGAGALSDDIPEPLDYGQTGDPGTSTKASRSDHRHALSGAFFGSLPTFAWDANSGNGQATQNTIWKILQETPGNQVTNAPDDTGATGAFGVNRITFGAILLNGTGHIVQAQDTANPGVAAGVTTTRNHTVQRLSKLIMRIRALTTATPAGNRTFIGGFHETVDRDLTTLDDALGFWIQTDGAGVGNFLAYAQSSTTGLTTTVDTGVKWDSNNYMKFEMALADDNSEALFAINDVIVASITDNIPTLKVFGWGMTTRREAASNFTELMFDSFLFQGRF